MSEVNKVAPRVQAHVDKLRAAGLDTQLFFDALAGIRDDRQLSKPHRTALYKLVASESFLWYLEALTGAPVDRAKLIEESFRINAENAAAIKMRLSGDAAHNLANTVLRDDDERK